MLWLAESSIFYTHSSTLELSRLFAGQNQHTRQAEEPIYNGLVFSNDVPEVPHKRISMSWNKQGQNYRYRLMQAKSRYMLWDVRADFVDRAVDEMLLQRLQVTTLDEALWQEALEAAQGDDRDVSHLESEIKREKSEQDNIIASLRTLSHPDMVRRAQAQYEASERRITELELQIEASRASQRADQRMLNARPALHRIAANWASIPHNERRNLFQVFARDVLITKKSRVLKQVTVNWKDGTESNRLLRHANYRGQLWDPEDVERLRGLFDRHATQKEILQAFPKHRWRNLRARYKYHFGSENLNYTRDELPYSSATRWIDIEEYQAQAHNTSNNGSTTELAHGGAASHTTVHQ